MASQADGFDQRVADLEAHIDRLTAAIQQMRDGREHLHPIEQRLVRVTEQCASVLNQWAATGERYTLAVSQLETRLTDWNDIESRLQHELTSRFATLEQAVENEWAALRSVHEEPTRQLRAQAENLAEICVTTAGSAQTGLERAEARLSMLEADLHRRMDDLTRQVQTAVAELRQRAEGASRGTDAAWPLEQVTRLHQELRDDAASLTERPSRPANTRRGPVADAITVETSVPAPEPRPRRPEPLEEGDRVPPSTARESAERDEPASPSSPARWALAIGALAAVVVIAVAAVALYRQAGAAALRASEAQHQVERVVTDASQQIAAAQRDAASQIAAAREAAQKAQVTGDILAAPDLIRFNLVGSGGAARPWAQLLWSRSRGFVFSGSRLPPLSPGATYQVWLLTAEAPVSGGTFEPDGAGRGSLATDTPPIVPRPVIGVQVTIERAPGGSAPSGSVVLARAQ